MKYIFTTSTRGMTREEWLAERRKGIGGSDAAAVIGLSPYATPYTVWADKTGRLPEQPDNEAMRLGRDLEDYVARRWCEATGKRVKRSNAIYRNGHYSFALANVDRLVVGERAGLECKTTSCRDVKRFRDAEFPEQYYAQCVHYLAVTGLDRWYLAVLQFGKGFHTFCLERDEAEIKALMDAEGRFWEHVVRDDPPAPDGAEATGDALTTIYRESRGETVELFGREALLGERETLLERRAVVDARLREIENTIKEDMREAERGECGRWRVSWKTQTRSSFLAKKFAADHPEIDLTPYYKTTSSRPFKVTAAE